MNFEWELVLGSRTGTRAEFLEKLSVPEGVLYKFTKREFVHPNGTKEYATMTLSQRGNNINIENAVTMLKMQLANDPEYHETWRSSLAMAYHDEFKSYQRKNGYPALDEELHEVCNLAANRFLGWLLGTPERTDTK